MHKTVHRVLFFNSPHQTTHAVEVMVWPALSPHVPAFNPAEQTRWRSRNSNHLSTHLAQSDDDDKPGVRRPSCTRAILVPRETGHWKALQDVSAAIAARTRLAKTDLCILVRGAGQPQPFLICKKFLSHVRNCTSPVSGANSAKLLRDAQTLGFLRSPPLLPSLDCRNLSKEDKEAEATGLACCRE